MDIKSIFQTRNGNVLSEFVKQMMDVKAFSETLKTKLEDMGTMRNLVPRDIRILEPRQCYHIRRN